MVSVTPYGLRGEWDVCRLAARARARARLLRGAVMLAPPLGRTRTVPKRHRRRPIRSFYLSAPSSAGITTKAVAAAAALRSVSTLSASTRCLMVLASVGSSIFDRPEPSTSQEPACPMFHKPDEALSRKPTDKASGKNTVALAAGPAPTASSPPAYRTVQMAPACPMSCRRSRSAASMFCFAVAASERRRSRSTSSGTELGSTSSVNTPFTTRLPAGNMAEITCPGSDSSNAGTTTAGAAACVLDMAAAALALAAACVSDAAAALALAAACVSDMATAPRRGGALAATREATEAELVYPAAQSARHRSAPVIERPTRCRADVVERPTPIRRCAT
mmetsp:Transcript_13011/g.30550  ORF Transcript_13011/g.30550 Transcript_13011/m.30550 type:complete len:334 (+) Transcript_13011:78-1079(+)